MANVHDILKRNMQWDYPGSRDTVAGNDPAPNPHAPAQSRADVIEITSPTPIRKGNQPK